MRCRVAWATRSVSVASEPVTTSGITQISNDSGPGPDRARAAALYGRQGVLVKAQRAGQRAANEAVRDLAGDRRHTCADTAEQDRWWRRRDAEWLKLSRRARR